MALRRKFHQTKFFKALVVLGVLLFLVVFPPRFIIDPLRALLTTVAWPIESFLSSTAYAFRGTVNFFTSIGDLKKENERLQRESLELLGANAALREVAKENGVLRQELALLPRAAYELSGAEIIGRGPALGDGLFIINQGLRSGLRKNMPVIVGQGVLVGRVLEVFPYSATIALLTHPASLINGTATASDAKGIIKGEHGLSIVFDVVLQSDALSGGDTVVTSGLDPGMPRGLLAGTLQEARLTDDRLYQRASLISPVKFEDLRYVFVIKNSGAP